MSSRHSHNAKCFLIWREGHAVNWDCSAAELAAATGMHVDTVRAICRKRDWPVRNDARVPSGMSGARMPIDYGFRSSDDRIRGRM